MITITLRNSGGLLESFTGEDEDDATCKLVEFLESTFLQDGDTITVVESADSVDTAVEEGTRFERAIGDGNDVGG